METASPSPWDILQQPLRPAGNLDPRTLALLAALDQGWNVIEPVYLRPRWSENGAWMVHLILVHDSHPQPALFSAPVSLELDSLIKVEGWHVERYLAPPAVLAQLADLQKEHPSQPDGPQPAATAFYL
jgi:hypothetical protein